MDNQVILPGKLFVNASECGSVFIDRQTARVIDKNTCFYNCLYKFLVQKRNEKNINILQLKRILTNDLPFANILVGNDDPSRFGICADHRVIEKTCEMFKINIYVLTSGTHIYRFGSHKNEDNSFLCLFLHRNHYKIVDEKSEETKIISVFTNPNRVFEYRDVSLRRKKRSKNKNTPYKDALRNKSNNSNCNFDNSIQIYETSKKLSFKQKRQRGNRR